MWTPDLQERCAYIFVARFSGQRLGSVWISDNKEFALSWPEHATTIDDCEKQLTVTDQGYAIQIWRRQPRHATDDAGLLRMVYTYKSCGSPATNPVCSNILNITEPRIQIQPWAFAISNAPVTNEQRQQLHDLFLEFQDRISSSSYDLGSYDHTQITIKTTTDVPPSRYRPTRIPSRLQKDLDEHINKLLAAGRIVESDTPWLHNTVLVRKKDGSLRSLRKVLERFRIFNIKVSAKKLTSVAQSTITFLGHELSGSTYTPAERNIKAIRDIPTPTSVRAVKGFLGMANFFRKFVRNFASIAAPLYALCKDKTPFHWGEAQATAFTRLKEILGRIRHHRLTLGYIPSLLIPFVPAQERLLRHDVLTHLRSLQTTIQ
ncbi:hypothetical protein TELCIR_18761, partial [Teladorsagia circumcincta]